MCMEDNEGNSVMYVYMNSLVASILLLLTGENLEPVTDNEKVVQTSYLLIGVFVTALTYGNVHALVSNILQRHSDYQKKLEIVYDGMDRMKVRSVSLARSKSVHVALTRHFDPCSFQRSCRTASSTTTNTFSRSMGR